MELDVMVDPVALDLTVADGDGCPIFHTPAEFVVCKQYRAASILYLRMRGEEAHLALVDLDGRPWPLALEATEDGWWRVRLGQAP